MKNITKRLIRIAPNEVEMAIAELLDDHARALSQGRLVFKDEGIFVHCNEGLMPIDIKLSIALPNLCASIATFVAKQMSAINTQKRLECNRQIQALYEISLISNDNVLLEDLLGCLNK